MCPGVELLDHIATLFLAFWGTTIPFSIMAALIYISQNSVGGFPFLETLVLISKVYNLSSFSKDLFSQVTVSSGPDTPLPRTEKLGVRGTKILQKSSVIWDKVHHSPSLGFWLTQNTQRYIYTPSPQKMSLTCSMQQFAFSASFFASPVDHSVWHCLWEAQNKCHTCLAMTPTAHSGWLNTYKHYSPLVLPTLQPFLPSFWGPSTACLFNLSKSINC